jgi:tetratricopeptide (TPR) repeat protein
MIGATSETDKMKDETEAYSAVYHFLDDQLLKKFIARIPRFEMIEHLRNNEPLRRRCFPGFRISSSVPTCQQILNAYKKEIVDRNNGRLASFLCADWIRQQSDLARAALQSLGIRAENPADANSWINDVHTTLRLDTREESLKKLVRELAFQFSNEDIHIFISIISYGMNQETIRQLVEEGLTAVTNDPEMLKKRMESELAARKASIQTLEMSAAELQSQLDNESTREQEVLAAMQLEHDQLETRFSEEEEASQQLSKKLEDIQKELLQKHQARDAIRKQKQTLAKTIGQTTKALSKAQTAMRTRLDDIGQSLGRESARVTDLISSLQKIEERLLEERNRSAQPTTEPAEEEPLQPSEIQVPRLISPPPSISEAPKGPIGTIGNNAVCYQGIQRTFRNAVVTFLRDRLTHLFPKDHIQRMTKLFGADWAKAAQNANLSRESLGTTTTVRDDYDLLGTNHLFNVFDFFFDKLFTPEAGQPPNLPKPVKTRFLGDLKAIKDSRDPLSHPVEEDVSFGEAHHLLYCAQEVLKWLGCIEEAAELATLGSQIGGIEQEGQTQLRRLPSEDSIYFEFVGRNSLLKDLTDCFANPDNKRCLLAGDGGKGKSAAAFRFVQSLPAKAGRFQLIIWLSAKKRRFREGVPTTIESPDFNNAGEAVDRLLTEYGATTDDMNKDLADKKRLLFEYLNEFPAFVIADDIDTVLDDEETVSLFTHEIPHTQSSVLLTSRRAIPGIRSFIVKGFDAVEGEEFINSRIRLYGLNTVSFTAAVIKEIAKTTDGSPLYMDDLLRLAKIVEINRAIKIWTEKGGDEARKYALQREIELLSIDGRKVLVAAAVTDDAISFAELQDILELSEDRLLSALSELQTLFLFPKAPAVEGEQRYQINLNTKKLVRVVEGASEFYARIDTRSKALAGKLPNVGYSLVGSLIRQSILRLNAGQHGEAETILLGGIGKYPNAADLHGVLGYVYRRIGRVSDARIQFEAACKLKSTSADMFLHWLKMEIYEKEWAKAIVVADRALKILPDSYEIVERKVYTLRQAGFDLHRGLHHDKASKMWTEAVDEVKRRIKPPESLPPGARSLNASMYYSIVVSLDMLNQFRERNRWLERWEAEHPDDPQVALEKEFIIIKRGSLAAGVH